MNKAKSYLTNKNRELEVVECPEGDNVNTLNDVLKDKKRVVTYLLVDCSKCNKD
tara:strand:+ start:482 stop:643 length:162 start_codon:yes stop_codon:yes gene_type:complete